MKGFPLVFILPSSSHDFEVRNNFIITISLNVIDQVHSHHSLQLANDLVEWPI